MFESGEIVLETIKFILEGLGVFVIRLGFEFFEFEFRLELNNFKFVGFSCELDLLF